MSRRARAPKRAALPDPKFGSDMLAKFINMMMNRGKKSVAERIVYGAIDRISDRNKVSEEQALELLAQALDNVKPAVEVKSRRVGGATYQVPVEISKNRQLALALRWLVNYSTARKGIRLQRALAIELMEAFNGQGSAVKKRDDTHKMAQANKAFAHYAW